MPMRQLGRAQAGTTSLEDFESYLAGEQISSLPSLGVGFDMLDGGGFPVTYDHIGLPSTTHGSIHLANFPNGINAINQFDDIVMTVLSGYSITAVGYWNGDGQLAASLTATAYDASDNLLGSVSALAGTFAGFTSDTLIARVVFDGVTGDGWNHLDGLQTNASMAPVPLPAAFPLFAGGLGLLGLLGWRRETEGCIRKGGTRSRQTDFAQNFRTTLNSGRGRDQLCTGKMCHKCPYGWPGVTRDHLPFRKVLPRIVV